MSIFHGSDPVECAVPDGKRALPCVWIPEQDFSVDIVPCSWRQQVQVASETAVFLKESEGKTAPAFQIGVVASECFDLFCQGDPVMEQKCLI